MDGTMISGRAMTRKRLVAIALLSLPLLGMDGAGTEGDERRLLEERQAQLSARINGLKQEQDYLLFEKALAGSDSKYLVLDLTAGRCALKYRNRILRSFEVAVSPALRQGLRRGSYVLTRKDDGSPAGRALVFQDELILHGKRYMKKTAAGKKPPGINIGKLDLAALFFAVENGSRLYVRS